MRVNGKRIQPGETPTDGISLLKIFENIDSLKEEIKADKTTYKRNRFILGSSAYSDAQERLAKNKAKLKELKTDSDFLRYGKSFRL